MLLCECGEIYEVKNKITLKPDDDSEYFGYTVVMDSNVYVSFTDNIIFVLQ